MVRSAWHLAYLHYLKWAHICEGCVLWLLQNSSEGANGINMSSRALSEGDILTTSVFKPVLLNGCGSVLCVTALVCAVSMVALRSTGLP